MGEEGLRGRSSVEIWTVVGLGGRAEGGSVIFDSLERRTVRGEKTEGASSGEDSLGGGAGSVWMASKEGRYTGSARGRCAESVAGGAKSAGLWVSIHWRSGACSGRELLSSTTRGGVNGRLGWFG